MDMIDYYVPKIDFIFREFFYLYVNAISFTNKINHVVRPPNLLGTVKLDGIKAVLVSCESLYSRRITLGNKIGYISCGTNDVVFDYTGKGADMIIFGEYIEKSSTIYLFDCIYFNTSLTNMTNIERVDLLRNASATFNDIVMTGTAMADNEDANNFIRNIKIRHKIFLDMTESENYDTLMDYSAEKTDGIMLYEKEARYFDGKMYKNKPKELNTVDLLLHKTNDGRKNNAMMNIRDSPMGKLYENKLKKNNKLQK